MTRYEAVNLTIVNGLLTFISLAGTACLQIKLKRCSRMYAIHLVTTNILFNFTALQNILL